MLYEFISLNRDNIVRRTRDRVRGRPWPKVSGRELEHGAPLFLTQLAETLPLEGTSSPFASDAIGSMAARHGGKLLVAGWQCPRERGPNVVDRSATVLGIVHALLITTAAFLHAGRCHTSRRP
jgi:hypothetical protein